jgi:phosphoribosylformylglycinamidine cyclo-ligase
MSRSESTRNRTKPLSYKAVGVGVAGRDETGLGELGRWVTKTFDLHPARPCLPLGYFANVLPLDAKMGLAISTDGVGTKILIAQLMGVYDTVGIDCVAMNANDVLCVGARPLSLVDYIAVEKADPWLLGQLAKGLYTGAEAAGITIPAGEIAQVREMIHGARHGFGFDLVGTCVGTVELDRIIVGDDVRPGDAVVGLESSGIHSNGLTLARTVFTRAEVDYEDRIAELGRTLGEELLTPTFIYVREVLEMLDAGLAIKALIHVTGDGFLNLTRVRAAVGYVIDELLPVPALFALLQRHGGVADAEMFRVYNMGVGFCAIVDPDDAPRAIEIAARHGRKAAVIGYAVDDAERRVWIPERALVGKGDDFVPTQALPPRRPSA